MFPFLPKPVAAQTPAEKLREKNMDYMRRYAEGVLQTAAKGLKMDIKIEPKAMKCTLDGQNYTPHKVVIDGYLDSEPYSIGAHMAYWDEAGFDPDRAATLTHRLKKEFEELGFVTCGEGHSVGITPGDKDYPNGYPNTAKVSLEGQLNELVARAKTTALGRDIESELGPGV